MADETTGGTMDGTTSPLALDLDDDDPYTVLADLEASIIREMRAMSLRFENEGQIEVFTYQPDNDDTEEIGSLHSNEEFGDVDEGNTVNNERVIRVQSSADTPRSFNTNSITEGTQVETLNHSKSCGSQTSTSLSLVPQDNSYEAKPVCQRS